VEIIFGQTCLREGIVDPFLRVVISTFTIKNKFALDKLYITWLYAASIGRY